MQRGRPFCRDEVSGLIPGTALRPADVLTTAVGNGMVALDVNVSSPHALHSGRDCVVTAHRRKTEYYGPYLEQLGRDNISYEPLVWSSYGRPHAKTLAILRTLSQRISRRHSTGSAAEVFAHIHGKISLEIWRRSARQVISCWPGSRLDEMDFG